MANPLVPIVPTMPTMPTMPTVTTVTTAPPVNSQEIGFFVRNWVHYDNLATGLYRQTINARKVRDEFETKILEALRISNMENAVIQIAGGRLIVQQERHNQPLTLSRVEEILHTYYVSRNMPDDTANVMKFVKKQRGFEISKKLRKQAGQPQPPLPPPPPTLG